MDRNTIFSFIRRYFRTRCKENKIVGGVVIGHELVSDKYGDRTYITIIKTDDGYIEEKTGLSSYAIPENKRVIIEVYRWKKSNF